MRWQHLVYCFPGALHLHSFKILRSREIKDEIKMDPLGSTTALLGDSDRTLPATFADFPSRNDGNEFQLGRAFACLLRVIVRDIVAKQPDLRERVNHYLHQVPWTVKGQQSPKIDDTGPIEPKYILHLCRQSQIQALLEDYITIGSGTIASTLTSATEVKEVMESAKEKNDEIRHENVAALAWRRDVTRQVRSVVNSLIDSANTKKREALKSMLVSFSVTYIHPCLETMAAIAEMMIPTPSTTNVLILGNCHNIDSKVKVDVEGLLLCDWNLVIEANSHSSTIGEMRRWFTPAVQEGKSIVPRREPEQGLRTLLHIKSLGHDKHSWKRYFARIQEGVSDGDNPRPLHLVFAGSFDLYSFQILNEVALPTCFEALNVPSAIFGTIESRDMWDSVKSMQAAIKFQVALSDLCERCNDKAVRPLEGIDEVPTIAEMSSSLHSELYVENIVNFAKSNEPAGWRSIADGTIPRLSSVAKIVAAVEKLMLPKRFSGAESLDRFRRVRVTRSPDVCGATTALRQALFVLRQKSGVGSCLYVSFRKNPPWMTVELRKYLEGKSLSSMCGPVIVALDGGDHDAIDTMKRCELPNVIFLHCCCEPSDNRHLTKAEPSDFALMRDFYKMVFDRCCPAPQDTATQQTLPQFGLNPVIGDTEPFLWGTLTLLSSIAERSPDPKQRFEYKEELSTKVIEYLEARKLLSDDSREDDDWSKLGVVALLQAGQASGVPSDCELMRNRFHAKYFDILSLYSDRSARERVVCFRTLPVARAVLKYLSRRQKIDCFGLINIATDCRCSTVPQFLLPFAQRYCCRFKNVSPISAGVRELLGMHAYNKNAGSVGDILPETRESEKLLKELDSLFEKSCAHFPGNQLDLVSSLTCVFLTKKFLAFEATEANCLRSIAMLNGLQSYGRSTTVLLLRKGMLQRRLFEVRVRQQKCIDNVSLDALATALDLFTSACNAIADQGFTTKFPHARLVLSFLQTMSTSLRLLESTPWKGVNVEIKSADMSTSSYELHHCHLGKILVHVTEDRGTTLLADAAAVSDQAKEVPLPRHAELDLTISTAARLDLKTALPMLVTRFQRASNETIFLLHTLLTLPTAVNAYLRDQLTVKSVTLFGQLYGDFAVAVREAMTFIGRNPLLLSENQRTLLTYIGVMFSGHHNEVMELCLRDPSIDLTSIFHCAANCLAVQGPQLPPGQLEPLISLATMIVAPEAINLTMIPVNKNESVSLQRTRLELVLATLLEKYEMCRSQKQPISAELQKSIYKALLDLRPTSGYDDDWEFRFPLKRIMRSKISNFLIPFHYVKCMSSSTWLVAYHATLTLKVKDRCRYVGSLADCTESIEILVFAPRRERWMVCASNNHQVLCELRTLVFGGVRAMPFSCKTCRYADVETTPYDDVLSVVAAPTDCIDDDTDEEQENATNPLCERWKSTGTCPTIGCTSMHHFASGCPPPPVTSIYLSDENRFVDAEWIEVTLGLTNIQIHRVGAGASGTRCTAFKDTGVCKQGERCPQIHVKDWLYVPKEELRQMNELRELEDKVAATPHAAEAAVAGTPFSHQSLIPAKPWGETTFVYTIQGVRNRRYRVSGSFVAESKVTSMPPERLSVAQIFRCDDFFSTQKCARNGGCPKIHILPAAPLEETV